jgi:hypothetical protein
MVTQITFVSQKKATKTHKNVKSHPLDTNKRQAMPTPHTFDYPCNVCSHRTGTDWIAQHCIHPDCEYPALIVELRGWCSSVIRETSDSEQGNRNMLCRSMAVSDQPLLCHPKYFQNTLLELHCKMYTVCKSIPHPDILEALFRSSRFNPLLSSTKNNLQLFVY